MMDRLWVYAYTSGSTQWENPKKTKNKKTAPSIAPTAPSVRVIHDSVGRPLLRYLCRTSFFLSFWGEGWTRGTTHCLSFSFSFLLRRHEANQLKFQSAWHAAPRPATNINTPINKRARTPRTGENREAIYRFYWLDFFLSKCPFMLPTVISKRSRHTFACRGDKRERQTLKSSFLQERENVIVAYFSSWRLLWKSGAWTHWNMSRAEFSFFWMGNRLIYLHTRELPFTLPSCHTDVGEKSFGTRVWEKSGRNGRNRLMIKPCGTRSNRADCEQWDHRSSPAKAPQPASRAADRWTWRRHTIKPGQCKDVVNWKV